MSTDDRLNILWNQIVRQVKAAGEINPPLWRALDSAVPVTLDGATIVVGFDEHHKPDARFLELPVNHALTAKVLASVATKPLALLVIDGTTIADYEHFQARRIAAEALATQASLNRPAREANLGPADQAAAALEGHSATRILGDLHRRLHQNFVDTPHHHLTLVRARWLISAMPDLVEAEKQLTLAEPSAENADRLFSRAIERVAEIAEVPAMLVAVWFHKFKVEGTL